MELDSVIEIIIALLFFLYIVFWNRRTKSKKIVPFHKSAFRKKKPYRGKFILSCRDYFYCENDHTDQYIQSCWDEVEKEHKSH